MSNQTGAQKYGWRRLIPGLVISLVCLVIVIWYSNPRELLKALAQGDYRMILLGILVTTGWVFLRALVWRTLLRERPTYDQAFFTTAEGYLLNNLLPFRLGEIAKSLLMSQKIQASFWEVFPTVIIERILDLTMAAGLLFISLIFVVGAPWAQSAATGIGLFVLAALGGLYLLALKHEQVLALIHRIAARFSWLNRLMGSWLEDFFCGLVVITEPGRFLRVILFMLLNWSLGILQFTVFLRAFFPDLSVLQATFTLAVTALGVAAPSSPGGVGVLELAIVTSLAVFGLDPSTALAAALTYHVIGYLTSGTLGIIGLARDGETLSGLYQKARSIRQAPKPEPE